MNIRDYEEKIEELEFLEEEIILKGYGYYRGEKYTEIEKIKELKELYKKRVQETIKEPMTVEKCKRMILLCEEALEAILDGQEYEFEERKLTRANISEIQNLKEYYYKEQYRLENGIKRGIRMYRAFGGND